MSIFTHCKLFTLRQLKTMLDLFIPLIVITAVIIITIIFLKSTISRFYRNIINQEEFGLEKFSNRMSIVFWFVVKLLSIPCVIVLITWLWKESDKSVYIIHPFTITKSFEEKGLTGDYFAKELYGRMKQLNNFSGSVKTPSVEFTISDPYDIEMSFGKISLKSTSNILINFIRKLRGRKVVEVKASMIQEANGSFWIYTPPTTEIKWGLHLHIENDGLTDFRFVTFAATKFALTLLKFYNPQQLAVFYLNQGNVKDAYTEIERGLKLSESLQEKGSWLSLKGVAEQKSNIKKSLSTYRELLNLDLNNFEALHGIGYAHGEIGNHDSALYYYRKLLDIEPNNTFTLTGVGVAYYELDSFKLEADFYNKAIAEDSNNIYAIINLAVNKAHSFDFKGADYLFDMGFEKSPDYAFTTFLGAGIVGQYHYEEKFMKTFDSMLVKSKYSYKYYFLHKANMERDTGKFVYWLNRAVEIDSTFTPALLMLADYHGLNKQYERANIYYSKIAEKNPYWMSLYKQWAFNLICQGDSIGATEKSRKLLDLGPYKVENLCIHSQYLAHSNHKSDALIYLRVAQLINPYDSIYRIAELDYSVVKGKYDEVIHIANKILEESPNNYIGLEALFLAYFNKKESSKAKRINDVMLNLFPNNILSLRRKIYFLSESGNYKAAEVYYQKLNEIERYSGY